MKVTGKIKNVVDFGAFVDIGLHETGLIHVSELSDNFVTDPMDVIKVGDIKDFTIIGLDADRKRISLSLKSDAADRIQHEGMGSSSASAGEHKPGARRVVVVKKGAAGASASSASGSSSGASGRGSYGSRDNGSRNGGNGSYGNDRGGNRGRDNRDYGSDDGMTYNPFAVLLKNKK